MRIIVKVGSSTLAHPTGRLHIQRMEQLCKVLSDLKTPGIRWFWYPQLRGHCHGSRQTESVPASIGYAGKTGRRCGGPMRAHVYL